LWATIGYSTAGSLRGAKPLVNYRAQPTFFSFKFSSTKLQNLG
jgi:hypothetical protein